MTISLLKANIMVGINFQVQHILRAYSQQLSVRSRTSKEKVTKRADQKDEVTVSTESKKRLMADKITHQIVNRLAEGSERNDTDREILRQLNKQVGRSLDITANNGEGIVIRALSEGDGGSVEPLSPSENDEIKKKLFEITRSIVYNQLIE